MIRFLSLFITFQLAAGPAFAAAKKAAKPVDPLKKEKAALEKLSLENRMEKAKNEAEEKASQARRAEAAARMKAEREKVGYDPLRGGQ